MATNTSSSRKLRAVKYRRAAVRFGRPPKELAGEVDQRILDSAHRIFLERGFEGASIEEIATAARSGKPTIYARYRDKRALFTAVMMRDVVSSISEFKGEVPTEGTVEKRLTSAAITLLHLVFESDRIALMRLAVAEANRFPDVASNVGRKARELSTEIGVHLLGQLTQSGELSSLPAFAPERLSTTARFLLDLVAVPMLLRALFEVNLKTLDAEIDAHVARNVTFFLAACRDDRGPPTKP